MRTISNEEAFSQVGITLLLAWKHRRSKSFRYDVRDVGDAAQVPRGGRQRQNMTVEEERAFLAPFFEQARTGGVLVVGQIKAALDSPLGRSVALASAYNLLHRHGWRKLPGQEPPSKRPCGSRGVEKKLPETLHHICCQGWAKGKPITLMFQDEARFAHEGYVSGMT